MSTGKVLLGALAGIAIGTLAGILYAPEKGSTTRKQIRDKGDDYVNKLKSRYDQFSDSVAGKFENAKKKLKILYMKGKPDMKM